MSWDIEVHEKVYQRLANEIFFRILRGEYALGAKLPSYIAFAKEAGSSPETVRKAIADREILRQLQGRLFFVQPEQTGGKINHIPVRLTAETVEPAVNLHAGMFVIMERTAGHPIPADLHPVKLRSLPCGDSLLHRFKHIRFSHLQT